mmetsp:Transcript_37707/g.67897  ORF Transcript_37707/g.67897 Transcript_37707/m.67897 type:complete len:221 (-) Transcript_37707:60-722(-)
MLVDAARVSIPKYVIPFDEYVPRIPRSDKDTVPASRDLVPHQLNMATLFDMKAGSVLGIRLLRGAAVGSVRDAGIEPCVLQAQALHANMLGRASPGGVGVARCANFYEVAILSPIVKEERGNSPIPVDHGEVPRRVWYALYNDGSRGRPTAIDDELLAIRPGVYAHVIAWLERVQRDGTYGCVVVGLAGTDVVGGSASVAGAVDDSFDREGILLSEEGRC